MGIAGLLFSNTLRAAYARHGLTPGRSVLLAVSGGADSCALLVGTARVRDALGLRVEVATLDHGLRPEAGQEAAAVARLAARWGLSCHVRALALAPGAALEARARQARYSALEALRRERGLDVVATAHTASDQAETLLMRLVRGTSLRGARGIHAERPFLIRPLLERTREEVEAFLAEEGVVFARDPMNAEATFLRTRVRRDVLPSLSAAAGFAVAPHLAAFSQLAAEDEALLTQWAEGAWRRLRAEDGSLDAVGVRALERPLRRRVLARLLSEAGATVDGPSLARVLDAVDAGATVTVHGGGRPGGLRLVATGGRVRCVHRRTPAVSPEPVRLDGRDAEVVLAGSGWRLAVRSEPPAAGELALPLSPTTPWPLWVRTRRAGDRVRGPAGSRKLQDVLVDRRVPREQRDALPVVTDAEGRLLWVPGIWNSTVSGAVELFLRASPPSTSMLGGPAL
jgi:tRNA(Ile)-lysidine synthase